MVLKLDDAENRIVELIQADKGHKEKTDTIKYIITEYKKMVKGIKL